MIEGKELWLNSEKLKREFVKIYNEKNKTNFVSYYDIPKDNYLAFNALSSLYVEAVIADKAGYNTDKEIHEICRDKAKRNYDDARENDMPTFEMLDIEQKNKLIELQKNNFPEERKKEILTIKQEEARKIAELTVNRIINLVKDNKLKKDEQGRILYTPFDILFNITNNNLKQEDYLIESEYEEWLRYYCGGEIPRDENGVIDYNAEINVYCFQNADLTAGNFIRFGGNIGADDGVFVIAEQNFKELINNEEIFKNGVCINIPKLSARLGNVPLGNNPICIKQTVKIKDLKTTGGGLKTAYFGEFGPPLSTQGGYTEENGKKIYIEGKPEAVVPQTKFLIGGKYNENITIISFSQNISQQNIMEFAKIYIEKSLSFQQEKYAEINAKYSKDSEQYKSEKKRIDNLVYSLDNDYEILKEFRAKLNESEKNILASLLINMKNEMMEYETGGKKR